MDQLFKAIASCSPNFIQIMVVFSVDTSNSCPFKLLGALKMLWALIVVVWPLHTTLFRKTYHVSTGALFNKTYPQTYLILQGPP